MLPSVLPSFLASLSTSQNSNCFLCAQSLGCEALHRPAPINQRPILQALPKRSDPPSRAPLQLTPFARKYRVWPPNPTSAAPSTVLLGPEAVQDGPLDPGRRTCQILHRTSSCNPLDQTSAKSPILRPMQPLQSRCRERWTTRRHADIPSACRCNLDSRPAYPLSCTASPRSVLL